jgi:hypothetical protein
VKLEELACPYLETRRNVRGPSTTSVPIL